MHHWCFERRQELAELAREKGALLVYSEEVLNEALFDLLSVEGMERIFQNVEWIGVPEVLRKIYDMGAGFRVNGAAELDALHRLIPSLNPGRLLFVRRGDRWENHAHELDSAMHVVAENDRLSAGTGPGAKALLRVSVKRAAFSSPSLEPALTAKLRGVYLEPEGAERLPLKDMLPGLCELTSLFPPILCLGDGLGLPIDSETDRIDTATLAEQVEALMEVCAGPRLWMEPGRHLVSHAAILLARATDRVGENLERCLAHGACHSLYNLGRPDAGGLSPGGEKKRREDIPAGAEKDDLLVVTNVGGLPMEADPSLAALPGHYLKARRICQVPL